MRVEGPSRRWQRETGARIQQSLFWFSCLRLMISSEVFAFGISAVWSDSGFGFEVKRQSLFRFSGLRLFSRVCVRFWGSRSKVYRVTSLIRKRTHSAPYRKPVPRVCIQQSSSSAELQVLRIRGQSNEHCRSSGSWGLQVNALSSAELQD